MSPRSAEFLREARSCLDGARALIDAGLPARSLHESYYAMLYAARAALSEEELNAKTHGGIWNLFGERFVSTSRLDQGLYRRARAAERERIGADYEAAEISRDEAEAFHTDAERFVDAVADMFPTEER